MSKINFVAQMNLFMEYARQNRLTSYDRMLWIGLFYCANRMAMAAATHEWPDDFFQVRNVELNDWAGLEERAVRSSRERLKAARLIDYQKGDGKKHDPLYRLYYLETRGYRILPVHPEEIGDKSAADCAETGNKSVPDMPPIGDSTGNISAPDAAAIGDSTGDKFVPDNSSTGNIFAPDSGGTQYYNKINKTNPLYIQNKGNINPNEILDLFHRYAPKLPQPRLMTQEREAAIRKLLEAYTVEDMIRAFQAANSSDYMTGGNEYGWLASFDWVIRPEQFERILSGCYGNRGNRKESVPKGASGEFGSAEMEAIQRVLREEQYE